MREPGEALEELVAGATTEVLLCAPFAKAHTVERVLDAVDAKVVLTVVTRWRPEEVAAGVSDLEVLSLVEERRGSVWLLDRLHAKYFRGDENALIGSANLTHAALGWRSASNLELLVRGKASDPALTEFEHALLAEATPATSAIAREVAAAAELLARPAVEEVDGDPLGTHLPWAPQLREPRELFLGYVGDLDRLSEVSRGAAITDLLALELPPGLESPAMRALVATRLRQTPLIARVNLLLGEPRRFGEVRDLLAVELNLDRDEATRAWQTMMRWLLYFLPGDYQYGRPRHSETFEYVG